VRLSVVIPTLDEAGELPATLRSVLAVPEVAELIVSDGGSRDGTVALARQSGARVLSGAPGRGSQLRRGAEAATHDVVILLHADTWLPLTAGGAIQRALGIEDSVRTELSGRRIVGGGFRKTFRSAPWPVGFGAAARSAGYFRLTGRLLGDQAIFVRRTDLIAAGGVPALPLMEEFSLCRALRARGRLVLADATVSTSGRTFRRRGAWRTWWLMLQLQVAWARGVTPEELAARYHGPPFGS